jgi:hypothetical protein
MLRQQPQARDGPGFIVGKTHELGASDKPQASTMRIAARRNGGSPGCHLGLPFPCPAAGGDCPWVPPAGAGIRGFRTAGDLRAPAVPGPFRHVGPPIALDPKAQKSATLDRYYTH